MPEIEDCIIFGLEIDIKYFDHNCEENYGKCVYILCDCQKAIDTLTVHHELVKHPEAHCNLVITLMEAKKKTRYNKMSVITK